MSFKYDPFGRRICKSSAVGTSVYAYDHNDLVEETNASGTLVARYTRTEEIDEPLAMLRNGSTNYYEQDDLNSVTSLTTSAGAVAQTYTFDSFGNTTATSGSLTNPFRFAGREFDTESNLYYMRARYFDPSTGRFLSEDPWDQGSQYASNLYAYVGNNPTKFVDPFGLYKLKLQSPPIPAPSAGLDSLLNCMERLLNTQLTVTATTPLPGEPHEDPGHAGGTSVDIRPPAGIPADKVFCAAGQCGAARGLNEGPGGATTTYRTADNYHLQLNPTHNPKKRNDIPPGCGPGPGPGKKCPKSGQPAPCPSGFRCT